MANGGTDKVLQTIDSELPKDLFIVDYYYCDSAPYIGSDFVHPDTDHSRVQYVKDNGFNVIIGQRKNSKSWDKAISDGWVEGKDLFEIEEACNKGTIIQYLLSDAGQIEMWDIVKKHLTKGKVLYFSHGFGVIFRDHTKIVPPKNVNVILHHHLMILRFEILYQIN